MKLLITLIICSFFVGFFSPGLAGDGDIDLTIEGELLSARLKGIPLKIILEKLEREKGIWFRGNSSLFEEAIQVEFTDLPFAEALGRILASMNYSLIFDGNDRLAGVILIGKGIADRPGSEGRAGAQRRAISPSGRDEHVDMDRSFTGIGNSPRTATREYWKDSEVIENYPQPGVPAKVAEEEPKEFTVIRDCSPPGSPGGIATGDRDDFTAVRNCPPPGGPAHTITGDPGDFRVTSDCSPPGDPAKVSAQQLEKFNVVKNCPPPGS